MSLLRVPKHQSCEHWGTCILAIYCIYCKSTVIRTVVRAYCMGHHCYMSVHVVSFFREVIYCIVPKEHNLTLFMDESLTTKLCPAISASNMEELPRHLCSCAQSSRTSYSAKSFLQKAKATCLILQNHDCERSRLHVLFCEIISA